MELQLAVQSASRSNARSRHVPNYLKPSAGSCHHACKYGGSHAFQEPQQPKPRKQPPAPEQQKRSLIKVRLLPRKLFGGSRSDEEKKKPAESVEWKDIVAYATVPDELGKHQVMGAGDVQKGDAIIIRDKKSHDRAKSHSESPDKKLVNNKTARTKMMTGKASTHNHKNMNTDIDTKRSVRPPPRGNKKPTLVVVKKEAEIIDRDLVDGYQPLSPSLLQKRASLLRDLEEEMVAGHHEAAATVTNEFRPASSALDPEEFAAAEAGGPVPAHRRAKSMGMSSRSVRFPFARQPSKNSAAFKLRSRSSKGPILPPPDEAKLAKLVRSRRGSSVGGSEDVGSGTGRGVQLRIRSLRRRGVGGGGSAGAFVVPAVALRHQKTLEKKRSQRLYNNVIEETASRLVKTRKSRVKALVGAFESVISKIAK